MVIFITAVIGGAFLRRWFGGGFFSARRWVRVAVALVAGGAVAGWATGLDLVSTPAGVLAACCWLPGHGSYMDMGAMRQPDNEWLRRPLNWIFGPEPPYTIRRDLTGLIANYSAFTIPAGAWLVADGFAGWYLAPAGAIAALAYWTASRCNLPSPATWGEWAAGAVVYGAIALA